MYKILRSDGAVLYDVNDPDIRLLTEARGTFEIGQPGSLQFAMVPAHPYYDEVEVMETYVTALRENTEIFYGRIIDINVDKTTGVKQIECAGALQFLDDGELAPITGSDGKGLDLMASAFLTRCITAHNTEINNDPKRVINVGTVNHAKASMTKKYNLTGYTQVKNALDSNLISEYGGYFRIRKDGNNHVIDWLDTYSEPNTSPIRLRENIQNQENTVSAGDLFTMIRPSGKNNLVLEPIAISNDLVTRYGRIIKSVNFKDEETEAGLRSAVADYIAEMAKGLGKSCTVRIVDMHFLDGSVPSIRLGSTYTNIAGFEGEPMVVSGMELNFTNPADDSVTLRNAKDLAAGTKGSVSSKGSAIQDMAKDRKGFQNIWQHITEGEDWLRLHAERIEINAQNLVELVGTFERYAEETTETIQFQGQDISVIKGTGVLQNTDQITQVAGMFSSKYYIVPVGSRPGRNPNQAGWYEAQQYLVKESDVNSGIELYASPAAAMNGRAINTTSQLASLVGQYVTRMVRTADTTPVDGKTYYSKTLGVMDGTSFTISDEGQETNVGKLLKETYEGTTENGTQIQLIEGSALWEHRDHITGVCGEYEVRVDQQTGEKTLVIVSGGGIKIRRDNTEFGLYDSDNLTSGIIVGKINNPTEPNPEKIAGTMVDITAQQVRIGTTTNVANWMESTGRDINDLQGLIADKAYIADLEALDAKFSNINARLIEAGQITPVSIVSSGMIMAGGGLYATNGLFVGGVNCTNLPTIGVTGVQVVPDGDDQYKLQYQTFSSGWTDAGSFSRAASINRMAGEWSGAIFTARALDANDNELGRTSTTIRFDWGSSELQVKSGTDILITEGFTFEAHSGVSSVGGLTTINEFDDDHKAYGLVKADSLGPLRRFAVDATSVYDAGSLVGHNAGVIAGGTAAGLSINSTANTVERSISSETKSLGISARLSAATYNTTTHKYDLTIYGRAGTTDMGSITPSTGTEAYDAGSSAGYSSGVTAGGTAAGLTINSTANTVERSISSETKSLGISARLSAATYNTTTHKYDLTIYGRAGTTDMGSITPSTGTEAYDAGSSAGYSSGVTAGGTAAGLSINSTAKTVERSISSETKSIGISARLSAATYNTTTHKYDLTIYGRAGTTDMGSITPSTGTEAYDAGVTAGEGHFTKAAITLQGAEEKITPINNSGTVRYTQYSKLYKGDGGSYYGRGVAVPNAYVKVGDRYDPRTLYAGDGILHYDRGHEVTSALVPDSSGSIYRYGANAEITRYKAGTSYTTTNSPYYTKTS